MIAYAGWTRANEQGVFGWQAQNLIADTGWGEEMTPAHVQINAAHDIRIERCRFESLGAIGMHLGNNVSETTIQGNLFQDISNAADLAKGLEPLFGVNAKYFLSIGLFAAGITSAITAPLAAAFVASGCLGWEADFKSKKFRMVWMFILGLGVVFSTIGFKSIEIIKFAQVANGLLLPIIAGFLLWVMNKASVLGTYKNSKLQNVMGIIILVTTVFLGVKGILSVFILI